MQSETLEEKTLDDGSRVSLVKRPFIKEMREALGLPQHASEMGICLVTPDSGELNTALQASWYLGESAFREIYDAIEDVAGYMNAYRALRHMQHEFDARKLVSIGPAARITHAPFAREFIPQHYTSSR